MQLRRGFTSLLILFFTVQSLSAATATAEFAIQPSKVAPGQVVTVREAAPAPRGGFFRDGDVRDVFGNQLQTGERPELKYFSAKRKRPAAEPVVSQPQTQNTQVTAPSSADDLLSRFGDPSAPVPVKAVENAPRPFQAVIAALESGQDELAFQYAKQYARYMDDVRRTSARAVSLTGLAMEREGAIEDGGWTGAPQFYEDRMLLEKDLASERAARVAKGAPEGQVKALDDRARALVERAKATPSSEGNLLAEADQRKHEDAARKTLRAERSGQVPVDPSGKVDVYWFFSPNDPSSVKMAANVERLYKSIGKTGLVVGVTADPVAEQALKKFRYDSGVTFPLRNASALAKSLGIRGAPTTAFIGQQSGKAYYEQGYLEFYQIDEIAKMVRGR